MTLEKLIPKVFYSDIHVGLDFFVDGLGFKVTYQNNEDAFYIIERDNLTIILIESDEFAKKDRPEIRVVTDDIHGFYNEIKTRNENLFHPNLNQITKRPWGLTEFALLDPSGVCLVVQQN